MINDVVIIGGGASGLFAAVYLKKNNPKLSVRILESLPRVGKKLALTGNGRCNITNRNIDISRYHGTDKTFAEFALQKYDRIFCEEFFESIGVPFVFEDDKAYPASLQAASVVDCLRFAADELGVITVRCRILKGQTLDIVVKDKGIGISDIDQARKPMFTTGGTERSGMGFTIMESFMTNLDITSEPGKGTTVHMRRKLQRRK